MLDNEIKDILVNLGTYADLQLESLNLTKENLTNNKIINVISNIAFATFKNIDKFEQDYNNKKLSRYINFFIMPMPTLCEYLEKINNPPQEKLKFFEWYIDELVSIYSVMEPEFYANILKDLYINTILYLKKKLPSVENELTELYFNALNLKESILNDYCKRTLIIKRIAIDALITKKSEKIEYLDQINFLKLIDAYDYIKNLKRKIMRQEQKKEKISEPPKNITKPLKPKSNSINPSLILANYIDLDNNVALRYLTLEERILCISLLKKNNIPDSEIRKFLISCEWQINFQKEAIDFVSYIEDSLAKLAFYEESYGLQDNLTTIKEALEIYKSSFKEEQASWKSYLLEEVDNTFKLLPQNSYEYEFAMARKLEKNK